MAIDYNLIANLGRRYNESFDQGQRNALLQQKVARDEQFRNALAQSIGPQDAELVNTLPTGAPGARGNTLPGAAQPGPQGLTPDVLNQLLAIDPERAMPLMAQYQAQQSAAQQARQLKAQEATYRLQYILTQSPDPARSLRLLAEDPSPDNPLAGLLDVLEQQGAINRADGIDKDEALLIAQHGLEQLAPIAGIGPATGGDGFTLSPGQTRFTAGGAPIATLPSEASGAADSPFSDISTKDYTTESIAAFQRSVQGGQADYSLLVPRDAGEKPIGLEQVRSVRNDVIRNSEDFRQRQIAYESVLSAARNPSPANDLALLFAIAKVYDPGSIVREGELQMSESAGDIAQRLGASFKRVFQGERLTDGQRRDFVESAGAQFDSSNKQQQRLITDARGFAERNKLPIEDVVPSYLIPTDIGGGAAARGQRSPTTAQRAGNAVEQAIDAALAPQPNLEQFQDGTTIEWLD